MAFEIISMGSLLVELMRPELGRDFSQLGTFCGPFPSGDTPIFINAAAKMGAKCGFIGSAGDDEFGQCVCQRLQESGVDMSHIMQAENAYTGTAFVYYNADGSRKFRFHLAGSGSEMMWDGEADKSYLKGCQWVHYTGFTLESSANAKKLVYETLEVLDKDTKVSFDPNLRGKENVSRLCGPIIERANLILPSIGEAGEFFDTTDDIGCKKWMGMGKIVVQKRGSEGSRVYDGGNVTDVPSFKATEVDPTGAGDTFAAAFIAGLLDGKTTEQAALFANVAGGFAVSVLGPMEGAVTKDVIENFLDSGKTEIVWSDWM